MTWPTDLISAQSLPAVGCMPASIQIISKHFFRVCVSVDPKFLFAFNAAEASLQNALLLSLLQKVDNVALAWALELKPVLS